jgi:hypothetical protein
MLNHWAMLVRRLIVNNHIFTVEHVEYIMNFLAGTQNIKGEYLEISSSVS